MERYKLTYIIEAVSECSMKALENHLKNNVFPYSRDIKHIDDGRTPYSLDDREVQGFVAEDIRGCAEDYDLPIPNEEQIDNIMDMMEKRFDANIGMSWDIIAIHIQDEMGE